MRPSASPTSSPLWGLVWTLIRTDFKTRYHGTLSGFVWALLKPAAMFLVLMWIFSFIFASDPNYKLNLVVGLFLWDFFAESTKVGLTCLHTKGFLLTKARFPAWILVVTSASNALIALAVFAVIMIQFLVFFGEAPGWAAVGLFVVYQLHYLVIVAGVSLAASVLFLRYRDLNQVWEVALQAGFFIAPIIYPLGLIPEKAHAVLYLWPPTPIIQFSRSVLIEGAIPTTKGHLLLAACSLAILVLGAVFYRNLAPRSAEYL